MFIKIEDNYNPLTLLGSGHRLINVNHIIHVTDLSKRKDEDKVRVRVESRIYLSTGEYIDTVHSVEEIERKILG
jgi:hypothetical protein